MNKEEYEKLEILKIVEGNEIVEKYYNPITCTYVSQTDIDCYKYKQALLDIKVLIQHYGNEEKILNIINEALGDKENENK